MDELGGTKWVGSGTGLQTARARAPAILPRTSPAIAAKPAYTVSVSASIPTCHYLWLTFVLQVASRKSRSLPPAPPTCSNDVSSPMTSKTLQGSHSSRPTRLRSSSPTHGHPGSGTQFTSTRAFSPSRDLTADSLPFFGTSASHWYSSRPSRSCTPFPDDNDEHEGGAVLTSGPDENDKSPPPFPPEEPTKYDDEEEGHGLPPPPPPASDDDEEDNRDLHRPPPPDNDEDVHGAASGASASRTLSELGAASDKDEDEDDDSSDNDLLASPRSAPKRRRPVIASDSESEGEWGIKGAVDPGPHNVGAVIPMRQQGGASSKRKAPGWRLQQQQRRNRMKLLSVDIIAARLKLAKTEEKTIRTLAKKHDVDVAVVEQKFGASKHWKKKRATPMRNALTGYYCRTINAERVAKGKSKIHYTVAQARVAKNPSLIDFPESVKEQVYAEYQAKQKLKVTGAHGTALGESKDAGVSVTKLGAEMINLSKRTKTALFGVMAPLDGRNSLVQPAVLDAGGVRYMFERHNLTETEFLDDFQAWLKLSQKSVSKMSIKELRKYIMDFYTNGARAAAGTAVPANYANYLSAILDTFHIHLFGWPDDVPWQSPSLFKNLAPLRRLAQGIQDKTLFWKSVSSEAEREKITNEYMTLVKKGLRPVPATRRPRSDKDKKRGPNKKRRSKSVVDDSDSGGEGEVEESLARNCPRRKAARVSARVDDDNTAPSKSKKARTISRRVASDDEDNDNTAPSKSKKARTISRRAASDDEDELGPPRKKAKPNGEKGEKKRKKSDVGLRRLKQMMEEGKARRAATSSKVSSSAEKKNTVRGPKGRPPGKRNN
uniref:Uncharacterized protein n=1 Tax=Mycena chlorophos TaxID=658473 RepID=A0ABQ0KU50_MYCCL|nr:predicted protein [Mycena chlorophos]